jgi:acetyltransferase
MTIRHLDAMFQPASVALIGASDREGSLGSVLLRNLKLGGFRGPVWLVNARHAQVDGQPAWRDVESLPSAPELAVICTPPATVPGLIDALGRKGCHAAIVLTAGLKSQRLQAGEGEGVATLEQAMLDAARPHLLRVLGPNCIGALVPGAGLNASFAPGNALPGRLAFVTQSGALATAMLDWANQRGIGFSHFVSLGDSADVDFGDMLDYLGSDANTRAILMYIESVKAARKFMSAARAAARNKPVILVKAGRAPAGAKAAASHTGALAGSDRVFDAAVQRAGMLRVDSLDALFDAAETLAHTPPLHGERLVVVTNGGGAGVLAADALALGGGTLAELSPATLAALDACLPTTWSHGNPVDIIGDAPVARYQAALRVLLAAPEADGLLFMHAPTAIVPAPLVASACLPLMQASAKPVLACWLGGAVVASARQATAAAGIAGYNTPERASAAWLQLVNYARNQRALQQLPPAAPSEFRPDRDAARTLVSQALDSGREWLGDADSQALLAAYGIPVVVTQRCADLDAAVQAAQSIGFPVALKVISPQVIHKSDVGGVALGLNTAGAVREACLQMLANIKRLLPDAELQGFTVQAMASRPGAHELIVGISTDPVFGPVLLLGEGGVAVELRSNHAVALPPLNPMLAQDLLLRSGLSKLLGPYRGRPAANQAALLDTLLKVSLLACDLAAVAELDVNPLLVDQQGVLALDSRVRVRPPAVTKEKGGGQLPAAGAHLAIRPYPQTLEECVDSKLGALLIRPIRPEDGQRLRQFYSKATPADMRLRFFMARREVSHSELARYSQIDYDREMTFVALQRSSESGAAALTDMPMLGEVRAVCDPDNIRAEFAIQVGSAWQHHGLGSLLMDKLLRYLRDRGTAEVIGECLLENTGMAKLARRAGFSVLPGPSPEVWSLRLVLRPEALPESPPAQGVTQT